MSYPPVSMPPAVEEFLARRAAARRRDRLHRTVKAVLTAALVVAAVWVLWDGGVSV